MILPYESRTRVRCRVCRRRNCRQIHPPAWMMDIPVLAIVSLWICNSISRLTR